MPLSDVTCRAVKPDAKVRKLSDSGGLQLWVYPSGSRHWRLAYRYLGKPKTLALGSYPLVGLAEARAGRERARKLIQEGKDPVQERRGARAAQIDPRTTFRSIAEELMEQQARSERSPVTLGKMNWMLGLAYPKLAKKQIRDIRPLEILEVLRQIESEGHYETSHRLRSVISRVFRLAVATGRADSDPAAPLRDALAKRKTRHRAAITDAKALGVLLQRIDNYGGQSTTRAALQLLALLFTRPGELRAAEWSEFDFVSKIWTIPADRTKMRRPHSVPLSPQAVEIFEKLRDITGSSRYVFPSTCHWFKPLCENTLNQALRRMGYAESEMCSHGFRSSASTLLNESGHWHPDAIERQLAHKGTDAVRNAYSRGDFWDERVRMMHWWANYLDDLRDGASPRRAELDLIAFCPSDELSAGIP